MRKANNNENQLESDKKASKYMQIRSFRKNVIKRSEYRDSYVGDGNGRAD